MQLIREIATWDWDVGDQGEPDGFAVKQKFWYQVVIEGWGEECIEDLKGLEGGPIEALNDLVNQWCAGYEILGFKTFRYQNPNCLLVSFAIRKIRSPGGLTKLQGLARNPPEYVQILIDGFVILPYVTEGDFNRLPMDGWYGGDKFINGEWIPSEKIPGPNIVFPLGDPFWIILDNKRGKIVGGPLAHPLPGVTEIEDISKWNKDLQYLVEQDTTKMMWVEQKPQENPLRRRRSSGAIKAQFRRNPPAPIPTPYPSPAQEGWLDHEYVDRLVQDYLRGDLIPPIVIREDGEIIEGHHRFAASVIAGIKPLIVVVPEELFQSMRRDGLSLEDIEFWITHP